MFDPLFDLKQKRVLITGGAGTLGALIAKALAERGADVTIQDLNQERLDEVRKTISSESGKASQSALIYLTLTNAPALLMKQMR